MEDEISIIFLFNFINIILISNEDYIIKWTIKSIMSITKFKEYSLSSEKLLRYYQQDIDIDLETYYDEFISLIHKEYFNR